MKMLLQILAAIIVVIFLFFLMGYLVREQSNVNEIEVKAPISFCWDIYHDETKLTQWMQGIVRIEMVEETEGMVGAKQKIVMKTSPGAGDIADDSDLFRTITKIDQPTYFSYDYNSNILDGSKEVSFQMYRDSITIIKEMDVFSANDLWMRSVIFLMRNSLQEKTQSQFDQLKLLIENEYALKLAQDSLSKVNPVVVPELTN